MIARQSHEKEAYEELIKNKNFIIDAINVIITITSFKNILMITHGARLLTQVIN